MPQIVQAEVADARLLRPEAPPCARQAGIGHAVALAPHKPEVRAGGLSRVGENVVGRVFLQRPKDFTKLGSERNGGRLAALADDVNDSLAPIDVGLLEVHHLTLPEA